MYNTKVDISNKHTITKPNHIKYQSDPKTQIKALLSCMTCS